MREQPSRPLADHLSLRPSYGSRAPPPSSHSHNIFPGLHKQQPAASTPSTSPCAPPRRRNSAGAPLLDAAATSPSCIPQPTPGLPQPIMLWPTPPRHASRPCPCREFSLFLSLHFVLCVFNAYGYVLIHVSLIVCAIFCHSVGRR